MLSPLSSRSAHCWENLVRAFDAELAEPEIEGIPIGSTLTDLLVIEFINGCGQWGVAQRCLDRLRWLRRYFLAPHRREEAMPVKPGRILVTWRSSTARIDDLILPVLQALSPDRCTVLYQNPNVLQRLPSKTDAVHWLWTVPHDRRRWHRAFCRCWPQWRSRLRSLSKTFGLPRGAMERLSLSILVNSQLAIGSLEFLERCRPAAIVTDYDRAGLASPLVLAARSLGIPAFSLQHGVMGHDAVGYVPVIADRMFCWGELHRRIMTEAGQDPAKVTIGGCPRLTRELLAERDKVRSRLNIDPSHRVVMLGTSPVPPLQRRILAAWFCDAVDEIDGVSGIVRLHPSESREFYAGIAREHPQVQFMDNSRLSLDESLAATDVVVVQSSGLGSDALVKRRLAVVVEIPDAPLDHGMELVEQAGCPRAASAAELAALLRGLLFDEETRRHHFAAAERFVEDFCGCFGQDSARRIAASVLQLIEPDTGGRR
ncbi:MAG: hypothetical protein ACLP9L_37275 [Thermoguttaceae bacterium]